MTNEIYLKKLERIADLEDISNQCDTLRLTIENSIKELNQNGSNIPDDMIRLLLELGEQCYFRGITYHNDIDRIDTFIMASIAVSNTINSGRINDHLKKFIKHLKSEIKSN